jgi:hypothetical protein
MMQQLEFRPGPGHIKKVNIFKDIELENFSTIETIF